MVELSEGQRTELGAGSHTSLSRGSAIGWTWPWRVNRISWGPKTEILWLAVEGPNQKAWANLGSRWLRCPIVDEYVEG